MYRYQLLVVSLVFASTVFALAGQAPVPVTTDINGDPLPPFAIARLGTIRWRHDEIVRFAAFLPDGKRVISVADDQTVRVWEFPSGRELRRTFVGLVPAPEVLAGSATYFFPGGYSAALSKDGKIIATFFPTRVFTSKKDETPIRLHEVETGKALPSLFPKSLETVALAFSPNGEHLISTDIDGTLRVWDWATGKELRTVSTKGFVESNALRDISTAPKDTRVYSPDGNTLMLLGRTNVLRFLDLVSGKEIGPTGHATAVQSVQFSPDSKELVTRLADGLARKWASATGKDLGLIGKQSTTSGKATNRNQTVSPDGRVVAAVEAAFGGRPAITLSDSVSGSEISKIVVEYTNSSDAALMFSPRNEMCAVYRTYFRTDIDHKIEVFDVSAGKRIQVLAIAKDPSVPAGQGKMFQILTRALVFSPDGRTLAASIDGKNIHLWDIPGGKLLGSLPIPEGRVARDMAFTPDNRCVAFEMEDRAAVLFEVASAGTRRVFEDPLGAKASSGTTAVIFRPLLATTQKHLGSRIALSPDNKMLALACADRVTRVWEIASGAELAAFKGHANDVHAIAFSPDSKLLASGSGDTTGLVWDLSKVNRVAMKAKELRPEEIEECWQIMAGVDGIKAFDAIRDLSAAPAETIAFLQKKLKPALPMDPKKIEELIAALDSAQYKIRTTATAELYAIGDPVLPALDKALTGELTLETKRRLEDIRTRLTGKALQGERLRQYRAVEILERVGRPEARQLLEALAAGAPEAPLTKAARAALRRE